jgi:hypothetical protein
LLEAFDLEPHVVDGAVDVGPPLIDHGSRSLQRRHTVAVLAVQLTEACQLEVAHAVLDLLDAQLDLVPPVVGDDGGVGLGRAELLQRLEAYASLGADLLLAADLPLRRLH